MKLLSRPRPEADESALGYLLRLAAVNGYPDPTWLTRAFEARFPTAVFDPRTANVLARLIDISEPAARQALYLPREPDTSLGLDTEHDICGASVKRRFIRPDPVRVCPACLHEKHYIPAAWDLSIFQVCPEHSRPMHGHCPDCDTPLSYLRRGPAECHCGKNLADIAADTTPVPLKVAELARVLSRKFPGSPQSLFEVEQGFPEQIKTLTLQETLHLVFLVGASNFGITWTTGQDLAAEGTEQKLFETLCNAAHVLADWPANFRDLLNTRVRADVAPTSILRRLGPAYETLFKNVKNTSLEFVWQEFESFAQTQWVGHYTRKHTRLGEASATHMPISEAARTLGLSKLAVGALLETGELTGSTERAGSRSYRVIRRESVEAYRVQANDHMGLSDASHALGLNGSTVAALARDGVLQVYQRPDEHVFRYWVLSRTSVEAILSAFSKATQREAPLYFQALSFQSICGIAGRYGKRLPNVVRAVCAGDIGPQLEDRTGKGVQAYSFSQEGIFAWLKRDRSAIVPDHFDVNSATLVLGTKRQVLYQWIARGFIESTCAQRQEYISREAVETFQQNYVVPARIAAAFGTSSTLLLKVLAEQGVEPCSGPNVDGGRQYLMRRREFEVLEIRNLRLSLLRYKSRKHSRN